MPWVFRYSMMTPEDLKPPDAQTGGLPERHFVKGRIIRRVRRLIACPRREVQIKRACAIAPAPTAASCRCRPTGTARPESGYRTPGRRADCCAGAPVWFEPRRVVSPRADARSVVLGTATAGAGFGSAPACATWPGSAPGSIGPGTNCAGRPERLWRKHRLRQVEAEELAGAVLIRGRKAAPRQQRRAHRGGENSFRDHARPPQYSRTATIAHLGRGTHNSSGCCRQGYRAPLTAGRQFYRPPAAHWR